jgi:hypothetical protein
VRPEQFSAIRSNVSSKIGLVGETVQEEEEEEEEEKEEEEEEEEEDSEEDGDGGSPGAAGAGRRRPSREAREGGTASHSWVERTGVKRGIIGRAWTTWCDEERAGV